MRVQFCRKLMEGTGERMEREAHLVASRRQLNGAKQYVGGGPTDDWTHAMLYVSYRL